MKKAIIVAADPGVLLTALENTGMPQRDKLEETIVNLASFLGAKVIKRGLTQRGAYFYSVDTGSYESASNIILSLSRRIVGGRS